MRPVQPLACLALVLGLSETLPLIGNRTAAQGSCQVPLTASRRMVAMDVESTTRSIAPAAESSGKEHRLQPALAARRFAHKVAALTTLYALNKALAAVVADAGIQAPSALIGELQLRALSSLFQVARLQLSEGPSVAFEM